MDDEQKYGILLQPSIKLHRQWFKECVKLQGIYVIYRAPLPDKHYTTYAEIDSNFAPPLLVGCLFNDHPNQYTTKKLGWVSELQENASLIHVDYDLPGLEVGALFIVPSGIDNSQGRLFRVTRMSTSMVYPASIICEIVPEYENTVEQETVFDFTNSDFNVLQDEEDNQIFMDGDYFVS